MLRRFRLPQILGICFYLTASGVAFAAPREGVVIYQEMCASCHGDKGEGVAGKHDEPLYGDRSLESLAKYIDRTMPEDKPELLDAEEAAVVARYIFDAFYSPAAREKQNPPRVDLVRLTNQQYLTTVADLVGAFRRAPDGGDEKGLDATYLSTGKPQDGHEKKIQRRDSQIDFDWKDQSPVEKINADAFEIHWSGALWAEETGDYELRLSTPNGVRLFLNVDNTGDDKWERQRRSQRDAPLIDGWVSSGMPRQESVKVFLLGKRLYPLRLEFIKYKEKDASLKFEWKRPHRTWEVIGGEFFFAKQTPRVTVVTTPFPADDASVGYERGTGISREWDQATTKAALAVAEEIAASAHEFADCRPDAPDRLQKFQEFCARFAERATRRPLSPELRNLLVERAFEGAPDPVTAVKRSVLVVLKSPHFLYPNLADKAADDFSIASRLALILWDSLPDQALWDAAREGKLKSQEGASAEVRRMVNDPRTKAKMRGFFHHWLAMDEAEDITKDPKTYPDFNEQILSDLRGSLEHFVDEIVWGEKSDYRQLLQADYLPMTPALAAFYGAAPPEGGGFEKVRFDPNQRAGIFTHPYLLSAFAYHKSSSPIHRGVFLTRHVLGRFLKPPPMAIEFMDDRFDASLTMREKVTELTKKESCMACHAIINPLGFSLENYDAVGRFRTTDNNKPVNSVSDYTTNDGETIQLKGPRDLSNHAVGNRDAQIGFVRQLFHHFVKQPPAAYGPETLAQLHDEFAKGEFSIRELLVKIALKAGTFGDQKP